MMNNDVRMEFSEERGTWNVFANGEWYYESENYEQAEKVFDTFFFEDESEYDESYGYED